MVERLPVKQLVESSNLSIPANWHCDGEVDRGFTLQTHHGESPTRSFIYPQIAHSVEHTPDKREVAGS